MRKTILFWAVTSALSVSAATPVGGVNGRYYQLFTPLTFYHQVANQQLTLNPAPESDAADLAVNKALMQVYLNRPDLVETTETQLEETGALRSDIDAPIEQHVEITEKAPSAAPQEPEVVPAEVMVTKPKFWTRKGDGFLQFMQNYISGNWYKGGESNYALMGNLTLEANYDNKSKWKWENKLEAKLGFQTSRSDSVHKFKSNEDLFRFTSKVGLQAAKHWYYTLQFIAYTQFARGLKSNDVRTYSDFMSPFNLNLALGMDYKFESKNKRLSGSINLSPIAINYRYVDRGSLAKNFGIDVENHTHSLIDFGSQITANAEWKMSDQVKWKSRLYAFTSYKRSEIEWENTFELRVSKYITANVFVYPRFDDAGSRDDDLGYWQFKEYSSLGFSYSF